MALKVLHLECGRHWYGGPVQVFYLLRGLQERGHENLLLCPQGSAIAQQARQVGLRVQEMPYRGDLDLRLTLYTWRTVRAEQPDIVHLHSRRGADTWGALGARGGGARAVVLSRRVDNPLRRHPLNRLRFGPLCDKIVAISEAVRRVLLAAGIPAEKVVCVPSAVDPRPYDQPDRRAELRAEFGLPAEARLVGVIAQLIPRKGHRFLLLAIPAVLQQYPQTYFLFCGQGPEEARLRALVERWGLTEQVIFAGFRSDIPRLLAGLDVVVHPALREGLGVVLLQAMAARRPLVATNVGGIPEAVRHGENGLLVPPGDSVALGVALCELLADPDRARALGERGREIVETKFSPEAMVEGNLRVYRELLRE